MGSRVRGGRGQHKPGSHTLRCSRASIGDKRDGVAPSESHEPARGARANGQPARWPDPEAYGHDKGNRHRHHKRSSGQHIAPTSASARVVLTGVEASRQARNQVWPNSQGVTPRSVMGYAPMCSYTDRCAFGSILRPCVRSVTLEGAAADFRAGSSLPCLGQRAPHRLHILRARQRAGQHSQSLHAVDTIDRLQVGRVESGEAGQHHLACQHTRTKQ
jgi:hypothetical protein